MLVLGFEGKNILNFFLANINIVSFTKSESVKAEKCLICKYKYPDLYIVSEMKNEKMQKMPTSLTFCTPQMVPWPE